MTLASIIEKETGVPEERADVAAVFINRLETGMKLQTDPTVIYALTKGKKDLGRPLYRKDLSVESPYNTYKYYGLPPDRSAIPAGKRFLPPFIRAMPTIFILSPRVRADIVLPAV